MNESLIKLHKPLSMVFSALLCCTFLILKKQKIDLIIDYGNCINPD